MTDADLHPDDGTLDLDCPMLEQLVADESCAGIRVSAELEPLGGKGSPINPAIHSGGVYAWQRRYTAGADEPQDCIVVDSVQSQAARLQRALADLAGYPVIEMDLSEAVLPAHLPSRITSVEFPHRHADAYVRDAYREGVKFDQTDLGRALLHATASKPEALLGWFPHSLIYGFWQSHTGKNGTQAKHPRVWTSEVIGWAPSMSKDDIEGRDRKFEKLGTKGDPMNIDSGAADKGDPKPSEVGHGQVPFGGAGTDEDKRRPPAMSFARMTQTADLSFATLRRVADRRDQPRGFDPVRARALLAMLALWAHDRRFGGSVDLRTGTTLSPVPGTVKVQVRTGHGLVDCNSLSVGTAVLETGIAKLLEGIALPAGLNGWGQDPEVLRPSKRLSGYIAKTWPVPADDGS